MSPPFIHTAENFVAGNIGSCAVEWDRLSGDPWVRQTVRGAEIPLWEVPEQVRVPFPYRLTELEQGIMAQEIQHLLQKGVIHSVHQVEGQFISNVFLRPKPNGDYRLILDLTELNKSITYEHFKMTSLQTAVDMMRPNCWMGSVDLKDAYYSVAVGYPFRKLLRFCSGGQLYEFVGMPNGLASAPRVFTKLLAPVFAQMGQEGVECFPYIDDSFVIADDSQTCEDSLRKLSGKLDSLGLVVHQEKSVLKPTQCLTFLGFELNSLDMTVNLKLDKRQKFTRAALDLLDKESPTVREVAGLIGLMVAYTPAVEYGGAHIKWLEWDKNQALAQRAGDFDGRMRISERAQRDILWWLENLGVARKIRLGSPQVEICTDASHEGWGAHRGQKETGGRWLPQEREEHINVLELKAILFGLKSLCPEEDQHVKVFTDNTTALAYVKHMGGVRSQQCNDVAKQIWSWAEAQKVWITVAHIPGVFNTVADFRSRHFADNLEWEINQKLFDKICRVLGTPDIDMFASRVNKKLPMYVAWYPDPEAWGVDAFSLSWTDHFVYLFPPFSLVGRTIQKLVADQARGILVAPTWPTQAWYARLQKLTTRKLTFRKKRHNLANAGKPENRDLMDNCPLGAYLLWPTS